MHPIVRGYMNCCSFTVKMALLKDDDIMYLVGNIWYLLMLFGICCICCMVPAQCTILIMGENVEEEKMSSIILKKLFFLIPKISFKHSISNANMCTVYLKVLYIGSLEYLFALFSSSYQQKTKLKNLFITNWPCFDNFKMQN